MEKYTAISITAKILTVQGLPHVRPNANPISSELGSDERDKLIFSVILHFYVQSTDPGYFGYWDISGNI